MTAQVVYDAILHAARRQMATSSEADAIEAAGLGGALLALLDKIAANAANPIADLAEDLLGPARKGPSASSTAAAGSVKMDA